MRSELVPETLLRGLGSEPRCLSSLSAEIWQNAEETCEIPSALRVVTAANFISQAEVPEQLGILA